MDRQRGVRLPPIREHAAEEEALFAGEDRPGWSIQAQEGAWGQPSQRWAPFVLLALAGIIALCYVAGLPTRVVSGGSQPSHMNQAHGVSMPLASTLDVSASSAAYGSLSEETRRLYGWSMILEADREAILTVHTPPPVGNVTSVAYEWTVTQKDGAQLASVAAGPRTIAVNCTKPGVGVTITVIERVKLKGGAGGAPPRYYHTDQAVCKLVRREVRVLTRADRERYLDALETFYRVDLAEGRRLYGPEFANNAWITACHNTLDWCLHRPSQFLAVHSAFVHWAERAQRMIDPLVVTPYWDHMIDALRYGPSYRTRSPVFREDWFGAYEDDFLTNRVITGGRFGRMPVAKDSEEANGQYNPGVNAWGSIHSGFTLNDSPYTTRGSLMCGIESLMPFAPPSNLFDCYDKNNDWKDASICLYFQVHSQLHGHLSGAWQCAYNLSEVYEAHRPAYSKELLSFVATAGKLVWNGRTFTPHRTCDRPRWNNCTCHLDTDRMPLDELYGIMEEELGKARDVYPGEWFISERPDGRWGFLSNGRPLSDEDNERLMRMVARLWCQAAVDGHFTAMSSLNDPIFYTSHAWFDRLWHALHLLPEFQSRLNYTWPAAVDTETEERCEGDAIGDTSPFRPMDLGLGLNSNLTPANGSIPRLGGVLSAELAGAGLDVRLGEKGTYTMRQLTVLLHPTRTELPYVYDDLHYWGGRRWRPKA